MTYGDIQNMKKKPYKQMYVIECELCNRITPVKKPDIFNIFDPWNGEPAKYRTTDDRGNLIWVRFDNWYSYGCNTWEISDETIICDKCKQTIKLAKALQELDKEELDTLQMEMHNR